VAEFESEKFEMQKQHTNNIQELLDETNQRLQKMEAEYNKQSENTVCILTLLSRSLSKIIEDYCYMQLSLIMDAFTCNLFKNIKYGKVKNAQLFQLS
jgi:hypothetical protein